MKNIIVSFVALFCTSISFAETFVVYANQTSFSPDYITVLPGDVVRWEYASGFPHSVTSGTNCTPDGYFDADLSGSGASFEWTVPEDSPSSISYFYIPHCNFGMTGMINVETSGPVGHMEVVMANVVNPDIMTFSQTLDGELISILGGSLSGSTFNLGVEIQDDDVDVEISIFNAGTGAVNLLDVTTGTEEQLISGIMTLLVGHQYMFHGSAGSKGTMGFSIIWPETGIDEGASMSAISFSGDASISSATGDKIMFTTTSGGPDDFITIQGEGEIMMAVIGGVSSSTLTLPASGNEGLVTIPLGSHIIELNGFAVLTLDMSDGGSGLPEDVNGDGVVNVSDLLAVIGAWGATSP